MTIGDQKTFIIIIIENNQLCFLIFFCWNWYIFYIFENIFLLQWKILYCHFWSIWCIHAL